MAHDLIDKFTGSAGTALVGHTPDLGTTPWDSSAPNMYSLSNVLLSGDGYTYNAPSSGVSSLIFWPGTYSGATRVIIASFNFKSSISGTPMTAGVALDTDSVASVDCRFYYDTPTAQWHLTLGSTAGVTSGFAFPAANTVILARITINNTTKVILVEVSSDGGANYSTLFGGSQTATGVGSIASRVGIWYDGISAASTGVQVGNLVVSSDGTVPSFTISPTSGPVGTPVTVAVVGTGKSYVAGSPGLPTPFTASGGTGPSISSQVTTGFDNLSFTLNPGSSTGPVTIHDPSGGTATFTAAAVVTSLLKETCLGSSGVDITTRPADTGHSWTSVSWAGSVHPVVSTGLGTVRPQDVASVAIVRSSYVPPSADYSVRFKMKIVTSMGAPAIYLRQTSQSAISLASFYAVQYNATIGSPQWECSKNVTGTGTALGAAVPATYGVGTTQDLRLGIAGSSAVTITLYNAGVQIAQWFDSSATITAAGSVGLAFYYDATPTNAAGVQISLYESPPEAVSFALTSVPASVNVGNPITGTVTPTSGAPVGQAETVAVTDDLANTLGTLNFILGATAGQSFSFTATSGQVGNRTVTATPSPTLGTPPTAPTTVTNVASLSASPAVIQASSTTVVDFVGVLSHWLTTPPTITANLGITIGARTVVDDTHCHAPVTTTSAIGVFTYTDSTDGTTASGRVAMLLPFYSTFDFGAGYIGQLSAAGYTLYNIATGADIGGRVTAGVEISTGYGIVSTSPIMADPTIPFGVRWDTGGSFPAYGYDTPIQAYGTGFYAQAPPNWNNRASFAPDTYVDGTCPQNSTSTRIYFDPGDATANSQPIGTVNTIVLTMTNTGKGQFLPIATVGTLSGQRYGDLAAGRTISPTLDVTSGYHWTGIPFPVDPLAIQGAIRTGSTETGYRTLLKVEALETGEWDTTSVPGQVIFRLDGIEIFRVPAPTSAGRSQVTDG